MHTKYASYWTLGTLYEFQARSLGQRPNLYFFHTVSIHLELYIRIISTLRFFRGFWFWWFFFFFFFGCFLGYLKPLLHFNTVTSVNIRFCNPDIHMNSLDTRDLQMSHDAKKGQNVR